MDACIAAGMDVERWENPNPPPEGYSRSLKAKVVAFHQLHQTVRAHTEDMAIEKSKKEMEKHRKRSPIRRAPKRSRRR